MAPMRDGVKLATDIYLPMGDGRHPVLLYRTPYNKAGVKRDAEFFSARGYVVVAQDCRGRFASEGEFYPFVNEGLDGYDAIEWAATQPWSNGKVGTIGASYLAWDQHHAAMYRPPHLVAQFAIVGGANFIEDFAYPGGAPQLGWSMWILGSAASSPPALNNTTLREALQSRMKNPMEWIRLHPQKRAAVFDGVPVHKRIYEDYYTHAEFDAYWKQKGFYTAGYYKDMKDVPVFFLSGWYDYFGEGTLQNYVALSRLQKTPKKLWMGPWPHGTGGRRCGEADFGESAAVNVTEVALDWFDHWMKDDPFDRIGPEPVRIFRMGGGTAGREPGGAWRTAPSWPPPGVRPTRHYLHAGGSLSTAKPSAGEPSTYTYDPENPVPTVGGRYGAPGPGCVQNQAPLDSRPDILRFTSEPLKAPLDVTGRVRASFWVSTDAVSTDFTAKLIDVYPDGYAVPILDGVVRAKFTPGKPQEVQIDLGSTSNLFAAGHRLRVDVSSSNFPRAEPNPNTGEHPYRWTRRVKARNTVYHDSRRASYVELPLAP